MWDNNSIYLDVYGKFFFFYMAQFSANSPVENNNYWFLLLKCIENSLCLSIFGMPKAIIKIVIVDEKISVVGFFCLKHVVAIITTI